MEDDPTTPQERRFLRLDTSLQTAVRGHVNGMKLPLVGTTTQPMLLTLEFITDNMVPWAAHIIKKLGPHFDATTEQTASAAAKLLTTTLAQAQEQHAAGIEIDGPQDLFATLRTGGDPWTEETFAAYADTILLLTPDALENWQGVLQVLTLSKQQVLIDHVLTHTGLTAIAQIPYNEEEDGEDENPWRDLRNLLVDIPSPSVVDLVARMSPLLRCLRNSPENIHNVLDIAAYWGSKGGKNIEPGSANDVLHQFVQRREWKGDLAQTLMTALGITDVPDIEEEEEEEPSAGNWLSNMVPLWLRFGDNAE